MCIGREALENERGKPVGNSARSLFAYPVSQVGKKKQGRVKRGSGKEGEY